jgi:hypothetical protein
MTSLEFVKAIKQVVYEATTNGCLSLLQSPSGRKPSQRVKGLSEWYNNLSENDKITVKALVELVAGQSVFGMLAVLDGVRAIEDSGDKGILELRYRKEGKSSLLNSPDGDSLHDQFTQLDFPV